jgi:hypothetical protein
VQDVVNAASLSFLLYVGCFTFLTLYFEVIINNKITPTAPLREAVSSINVCHSLFFTFISLAWFLAETNWTGNKSVKMLIPRISPVVINNYRKFLTLQ